MFAVNSDGWAAYDYFCSKEQIPGINIEWNFHNHNDKNHPHVDPTDETNHSQKAEALNSKLKQNVIRPLRGAHKNTLGTHIQEFEWRQNHCDSDNPV